MQVDVVAPTGIEPSGISRLSGRFFVSVVLPVVQKNVSYILRWLHANQTYSPTIVKKLSDGQGIAMLSQL